MALAVAAVMLAGAALWRTWVPVTVSQPDPELERMAHAVSTQRRRVDRLEADLADLAEELHVRRGQTPRDVTVEAQGVLPHVTAGTAATPAAAAHEHDAAPVTVFTPDGGVAPPLAQAVRQVMEQQRAQEVEQWNQRRKAAQDEWLTVLKEKLDLDEAQMAQLQTLTQEAEARRAQFREKMMAGAVGRDAMRDAFRQDRKTYEEGMKAVLTPEQLETWEQLDGRERRPPMGRPPPGVPFPPP